MRKEESKMAKAIKKRGDLEPIYISLKKLLASGGMGLYLNLASDRIAEELIDGQEIIINFVDFPDLLFTADGLFSCRHILESYLPVDKLMDIWDKLREAERADKEVNSMAEAFRCIEILG